MEFIYYCFQNSTALVPIVTQMNSDGRFSYISLRPSLILSPDLRIGNTNDLLTSQRQSCKHSVLPHGDECIFYVTNCPLNFSQLFSDNVVKSILVGREI